MKENSVVLNNIRNLLIAILVVLVIIAFCLIMSFSNNGNETEEVEAEPKEEAQEEINYDVSMFETIDKEGLEEAFDSKNKEVIFFGRETCGYCGKFLPILQKAQDEYGIKIKYVDIATISEDDNEDIKK